MHSSIENEHTVNGAIIKNHLNFKTYTETVVVSTARFSVVKAASTPHAESAVHCYELAVGPDALSRPRRAHRRALGARLTLAVRVLGDDAEHVVVRREQRADRQLRRLTRRAAHPLRYWQLHLLQLQTKDGPWGVGLGENVPPKILLSSLEGWHVPAPPQKKTNNFYRIHNNLGSLFEKNKQLEKFRKISSKFVQNFLKNFENFSKISNIS